MQDADSSLYIAQAFKARDEQEAAVIAHKMNENLSDLAVEAIAKLGGLEAIQGLKTRITQVSVSGKNITFTYFDASFMIS